MAATTADVYARRVPRKRISSWMPNWDKDWQFGYWSWVNRANGKIPVPGSIPREEWWRFEMPRPKDWGASKDGPLVLALGREAGAEKTPKRLAAERDARARMDDLESRRVNLWMQKRRQRVRKVIAELVELSASAPIPWVYTPPTLGEPWVFACPNARKAKRPLDQWQLDAEASGKVVNGRSYVLEAQMIFQANVPKTPTEQARRIAALLRLGVTQGDIDRVGPAPIVPSACPTSPFVLAQLEYIEGHHALALQYEALSKMFDLHPPERERVAA